MTQLHLSVFIRVHLWLIKNMFSGNKKTSRLEHWDGRRRSSRSELGSLQRLWEGPVLLRLGVVLATMLVLTFLAYWWGPPLPYRIEEIYPNDLRVRADFEIVNETLTKTARERAVEDLPPNEQNDPESRKRAEASVSPRIDRYVAGMPLVQRGEPIPIAQVPLLLEEHRAYLRSLQASDHARRGIALFVVMSLLAALIVLYGVRFQPELAHSLTKIGGVCILVVITITCCLLFSGPPWHAVLAPLTVTAMILAIAYNPQFALLMSFCLALTTTVALRSSLDTLLIELGGLATAVLLLRNVRTRSRLVWVGAGAGLAYVAMTIATGLLSGQTAHFIYKESWRHLVWGGLSGFLLTGALPLVERAFHVITDVSLLDLADGSHPLLQELVRRAPGTYTHSMTVATLAESAAEAIGANPLLTRVGSYFHDIGKMLKPQYFIENQCGENRHDSLEPALSTLVIIGHIKDGLALAAKYKLPRPITEFIEQHHGTTLVEYFYREAIKLQETNGDDNDTATRLEASFRYPGPKPQSREIAIVMLADAAEGSSRALHDPAPGSIRKLVHDLAVKRLLDGQFEESDLTLTELHLIEDSICKSLIALHHARIKYPEEDAQEEVEEAKAG
jgi:putative nucleotidyltransferase with HDIG domain